MKYLGITESVPTTKPSKSSGSPAGAVFLIIGLIILLTIGGVGALFLFQRWQRKNVGYISLVTDNNL
jgi:hypothetical protein